MHAGQHREEPRRDPRPGSPPLGAAVGLTDGRLLEMYRLMALARALDERMWVLNRSGKAAFVISGQGHEGAEVGIVSALRPGHDWLLPYYRSIGGCLTFGMTPRDIMLSQFARAADPSSGGRQMPAHWGSVAHNVYTSSSPVGTQALHATGIALAARVRGTGQVAAAFMGEGSSNQGDVHEALNFATIHRLPVVIVVENNGYAISVPSERELAVRDVAKRALAFEIPGVVVDGGDVLACHDAARQAVERARRGDGPSLIEAKVTRLTGHSSDDQQTRYRSEEELSAGRAADPLPRFRTQLREAGLLTDEVEERLVGEIAAAVEDATDWAEAQPDPTPESGLWHVYAGDRP